MSDSNFHGKMVIHCPKKEQAEWLANEVQFLERNSREEMMAGWDRYRERTVFCVMGPPYYKNPTVIWLTASDDDEIRSEDIVEYLSLNQ